MKVDRLSIEISSLTTRVRFCDYVTNSRITPLVRRFALFTADTPDVWMWKQNSIWVF